MCPAVPTMTCLAITLGARSYIWRRCRLADRLHLVKRADSIRGRRNQETTEKSSRAGFCCGFHFEENCIGGLRRIGRPGDWPSDNQIVGARTNRVPWRGDPCLV